ncbi:lipopolysaccharide biosynthesis protein [Bizionia arctica]|uniref:Lipopolysaccharide biosynthesis protein n=1 Tax=Bizionia arctica TaxID=1495645 RepID=A0A917GX38_9FLAO|nr:lipopolysaccharide biosynthesis protein [Bizionia arctica]GGG60083.1 lipopolysaccharide biosynthesis protein [Bizionia arctica]
MQKTLKKQVLNGIAWRGSADILQQILQIVFTIILARLLTRGDFGLVAMALIVNRFVKALTSIGFGQAIIQSQEISKGQISALFYMQFVLNLVLTLTVYFGAGLAASFFEEPGIRPIIEAIAVVLFLQTFQFPNILMRKRMEFKNFSIAEISSMVISNVVAVIMALYGFGVWSLVWRLIIQGVIYGILSFYFGQWLPGKPEFKGIKPLLKFGVNMLGAQMVYFFAENMIGLLTGRYLGKEIMGMFNIAFNLAIVPASKIQSVLTSVLTPGFSKLQYEVEKFRANYTKALHYTSLLFMPFMVMLMAISNNLIFVFYGPEWSESGKMLSMLAVVGLLRGLVHILRSAIISKGKSRVMLVSTLVEVVVSLPLMYLLLPHLGIYGLICGYMVGALSGWVYTSFFYNKVLEENNAALSAIKEAIYMAFIIFIPVYSIDFLNLKPLFGLLLQLILGTMIFVFLLRKFERELFESLLIKMKIKK